MTPGPETPDRARPAARGAGAVRPLHLLAALAALNLGYAAVLVWVTYAAGEAAAPVPDFAAFWAAARLTLEGTPALAYDWQAHRAVEVAGYGRDFPGLMPWHYPPWVQLLVTPLGLLPLWPAMALWLALTGGFFLAVCRAILPRPETLAAALAAAPTAMLLVNGQIGFLLAGLLGLGLLALGRRERAADERAADRGAADTAAGAAFGLLALKPQLGLAVPVALAAGGAWRAFAAAALAVLALAALSWAALGAETWAAFLASLDATGGVYTGTAARPEMMANLYGFLRWLGLPFAPALAAQAALGALVLALLWRSWRAPGVPFAVRAALLAYACAAATPRILNYDLHLLVVGGLFEARHALAAGFRRGEAALLGGALLGGFLSMLFAPGVIPLLAPALFLACRHWHGRPPGGAAPGPRPGGHGAS